MIHLSKSTSRRCCVSLILQWNQPVGQATSDLKLWVFSLSAAGETLFTTQTRETTAAAGLGNSNDPYIQVNLPPGTYQIAIENLTPQSDPGVIKYALLGNRLSQYFQITDAVTGLPAANAGTITAHEMSPYAITVGAVNAANTPAFSAIPLANENFSGSGAQTQLWFDQNGNPILRRSETSTR
jgi:hypothetical protein